MSKRAINGDEGEFTVSDTNSTAGDPKRTERFDLNGATVHAVVTSGSYVLQASNDGSDWQDVGGGAITATGFTVLAAQYRHLRIFTTTAGDGEFNLMAHELIY